MNKKIICHDIQGNKREVDAEKLTWRPSVYGVLIENGKVLMSKQWDGYDFPGGGAEIWETIYETVEREFFEETGIKVKAKEVFHCETSFFQPRFHDEYWNCPMIYFLVEKISGSLSIDGLDEYEKKYVDMPEWIDVKNIDNFKFINSVDSVKIIKKAVKYLNNQKSFT